MYMKSFLYGSVLLLNMLINNVMAQETKVSGLFGLKWGATKKQVISRITENVNTSLYEIKKDEIVFTGGKYGDYEVRSWHFNFWNDKLWKVSLLLSDKKTKDFRTNFSNCKIGKKLLTKLIEKYGEPTLNKEIKNPDGIMSMWSLNNLSISYFYNYNENYTEFGFASNK